MGEEGRRLGGEGAPHSTLSTIMRREEANQAEVSVAHPTMKVWCVYHNYYCSQLHTAAL